MGSCRIDINRGIAASELDRPIDVAQAARALGVARNTVYGLIYAGKLGAYRVGTTWRTTRRALQDYLDRWGGQ